MYRGQLDEDRPRQGVLTNLNQSGGAAAAPAQEESRGSEESLPPAHAYREALRRKGAEEGRKGKR